MLEAGKKRASEARASSVIKSALACVRESPKDGARVPVHNLTKVHGDGEQEDQKEKVHSKDRVQQSAQRLCGNMRRCIQIKTTTARMASTPTMMREERSDPFAAARDCWTKASSAFESLTALLLPKPSPRLACRCTPGFSSVCHFER